MSDVALCVLSYRGWGRLTRAQVVQEEVHLAVLESSLQGLIPSLCQQQALDPSLHAPRMVSIMPAPWQQAARSFPAA